jgi:hypothetical protein
MRNMQAKRYAKYYIGRKKQLLVVISTNNNIVNATT